MAITVGALVVDLSANSAAFKADMGKSAAALKSSSARMNRSLGKIDRGFRGVTRSAAAFVKRTVSLRGIVATVAGGAGLGLLVKSALDTADSIAKTADAIGVSTAALQEYRFALGIAGVETAATDKGLKKFTRNMGELARTSSETQTSLKDLDAGLLKNLRSLNTVEEQLALGFRALASYADQTKRAAVAQALFGRAGIDMTLGIKDGAAALEEMRAKAQRLGLVIEESLLRSAEAAKDELSILGQVLKIKVTVAILANARAIADLATQLTESIPKVIKFVREWAEFFGLIKENEVLQLRRDLDPLIGKIDEIRQSLQKGALTESRRIGFNRRLNVLLAEQERIVGRINELRAKGRAPAKDAAAGGAGAVDLPAAGPSSIAATALAEQAATSERIIEEAIRRRTEAKKGLVAEINEEIRATDRAGIAATAAATRVFEETRTPVEVFGKRVKELKGLLDDSAISQDVFNRAVAQARERLETATAATKGLAGELRRGELDLRSLAGTITGVLNQALEGGIRSWKDLGRVALGVIQEILQAQLRAAAIARSAGAGGGILGSIFDSIAGLFGGGGSGAPFADAAAKAGTFTPFAHGGRPRSGRAALVGEKGPEVFVPDRPGTIIPNSALRGRGGFTFIDNSVTTIDARGADAGVDRKIRDAMERTQAATVAKVRDLVERGGRFSESFRV